MIVPDESRAELKQAWEFRDMLRACDPAFKRVEYCVSAIPLHTALANCRGRERFTGH
jgi:hypothetical protein